MILADSPDLWLISKDDDSGLWTWYNVWKELSAISDSVQLTALPSTALCIINSHNSMHGKGFWYASLTSILEMETGVHLLNWTEHLLSLRMMDDTLVIRKIYWP